MAYYKKTVRCGAVIEVYKYQRPNRRPDAEKPRAPKSKPTPEQVAEVNERNAEMYLRWRMNANFGPGDLHVVLTYRRGTRPTPEEARAHLERFLRKLRAACRQRGQEFKYISVTEWKGRAIHHHLVCSGCDAAMISALWCGDGSHGHIHATPLDASGQYKDLAAYLIKETARTFREGRGAYRKRWNESKNLIHPKPEIEKIKARGWREAPTPIKGYVIEPETVETGINAVSGLEWQRYTMRRIDPAPRRQPRVMRC